MLLRIKKVEYAGDYKLKLLFSNRRSKIVDFGPLVKKKNSYYFEPLKDINFFKQVKIDDLNYTIIWPNGLDLCPDSLYMKGKDFKEKK